MGISVVVGLLGGRWLDSKLDTSPWLMIVGLLIGTAAGFRGLFRVAKQVQREAEEDSAQQGKEPPSP